MVIKEKIERENQISEIRDFNRFYLLRFQLLNEKPFRSEYSLAEILVLNMLAEKPNIVSSELACQLQLDDGYLSRTLKLLVRKGLVDRRRSIQDSRKWLFNLTKNGNLEQNKLDEKYKQRLESFISKLSDNQVQDLLFAMDKIRTLTATSLSRKKFNSNNSELL
ncbi:MarR family transcriptional regulator [bacterium]|nr:MarR family transcriptional regulator [bacterium]QQR56726.1 MAG: MarR family transcriptional regulator [Candidatus Melainabacteria bacterium]